MTGRATYRVAGQSLVVEAQDAWTAGAIDALFAGWYLFRDAGLTGEPSPPALVMRSTAQPPRIPVGLEEFEIAGNARCSTDGQTSYIDIEGSVVVIGKPGLAAVEVWANGALPSEEPALTRLVTYTLAAALRRGGLFELHSGAVVHPEGGKGVLLIGPSGSGKSTLTVHLAAAGWSFLTDDVVLLRHEAATVEAWPLRRCFAVTSDTFAASRFLQTHTSLESHQGWQHDKQLFWPEGVFAAECRNNCIPRTLFFTELSGDSRSRVTLLSPGETMARLIRMSPWSCYDRVTAVDHLMALAGLARQATAYWLRAGTDLLDPQASAALIADYTCG